MKYYSRENKITMLRQWNGPSVEKNRENRLIIMNKEGSNCDLVSVSSIFCLCFAFEGHVSHTMNMKKADAIRLCLNAPNKYHPEYWAFMMEWKWRGDHLALSIAKKLTFRLSGFQIWIF